MPIPFLLRLLRVLPLDTAHRLVVENLDWMTTMGLHKRYVHTPDEDPVNVMGIRFPNTIGLAAGINRDGRAVSGFGALGFGHVEVGSVTARPQSAGPGALMSRQGESIRWSLRQPSLGAQVVLRQLKSADAFTLRRGVLGINMACSHPRTLDEACSELSEVLSALYARADYFVVNTLSLPSFDPQTLVTVLRHLRQTRDRLTQHGTALKPIAVKLPCDLESDALCRQLDCLVEGGASAVFLGYGRPDGHGRLCGDAVRDLTTQTVRAAARHLTGSLDIVACGGVLTPSDAVEKIDAGARLVQLSSGLIFGGPALPGRCADAVAAHRAAS